MRQTTQAARDKFQKDKITNRETRKAAAAKRDGLSQKQIDYQKNKRTARDTRQDSRVQNERNRKAARQTKRDTKEYKQDPLKGTLYNNRMKRKAATQKARTKYGISTRKRGDAPRQDGATAKGKDGVNRRYDAKTKTWKLVK